MSFVINNKMKDTKELIDTCQYSCHQPKCHRLLVVFLLRRLRLRIFHRSKKLAYAQSNYFDTNTRDILVCTYFDIYKMLWSYTNLTSWYRASQLETYPAVTILAMMATISVITAWNTTCKTKFHTLSWQYFLTNSMNYLFVWVWLSMWSFGNINTATLANITCNYFQT